VKTPTKPGEKSRKKKKRRRKATLRAAATTTKRLIKTRREGGRRKSLVQTKTGTIGNRPTCPGLRRNLEKPKKGREKKDLSSKAGRRKVGTKEGLKAEVNHA